MLDEILILTKVTASRGHANAAGLRLHYDAISRPSRFGLEIVCPLGVPFAKGDEPCIMWLRDFINKTLWIPACAGMTHCWQHRSSSLKVCL
jgi:hypothetical protein